MFQVQVGGGRRVFQQLEILSAHDFRISKHFYRFSTVFDNLENVAFVLFVVCKGVEGFLEDF